MNPVNISCETTGSTTNLGNALAIRDKLLITFFVCAAPFFAVAGEATYDTKDLPSRDSYFWFASFHRACHKEAPPSVRLLAFKRQVLDFYAVQLAAASSAKQAGYRESIRQVDNDEVAQDELMKMEDKLRKMGSASSALACKNMDAVINGQIAIGNIAMAQQRGDSKAVEDAVTSAVAVGNNNAQIIQGQLPEIVAALSARPGVRPAPEAAAHATDLTAIFAKNKALAEQGDAEAQQTLAFQYRHGRGIEKDLTLATNWYLKAAAQGNTSAQFNLGQLYGKEGKSTQEMKNAQGWYLKAAQKGHAQAQYFLGLTLMMTGEGDLKGDETAYFWLLVANKQDPTKTVDFIDQLEQRLPKESIATVRQAAASWSPAKEAIP